MTGLRLTLCVTIGLFAVVSLVSSASATVSPPSSQPAPVAAGAIPPTTIISLDAVIDSVTGPSMKAPAVLKVHIESGQALAIPIGDTAMQTRLSHAQPGDRLRIDVDDVAAPKTLRGIESLSRPTSDLMRVIAIGVSAGLILMSAAVCSLWNPAAFLIGADGRYSNSQTQLALWFGVVATMYGATVLLRLFVLGLDFIGGVAVTTNVLALTGISALSFGGAKLITSQKEANAAAAALTVATVASAIPGADAASVAKAVAALPTKVAAGKPKLADLTTNDSGQADLGDFQMLLITVVASAIFALASYHLLSALELAQMVTLPDVDSALLGSFGVGQGAYLVKKAALPLGRG